MKGGKGPWNDALSGVGWSTGRARPARSSEGGSIWSEPCLGSSRVAVQALAEGISQGVVVITPSLTVELGCRPPLGSLADNVVRIQSMRKN